MENDVTTPNTAGASNTSSPSTPGNTSSTGPATPGSIQHDMAAILKDTRLPEVHGPAATKEPLNITHYDTTLADPERTLPKSSEEHPEKKQETLGTGSAPLVSLHTLKDDLQHVVQENKISYVRAIALEEERRAKKQAVIATAPRSHMPFILLGLFVGLGVLAVGAVLLISNQRTTPTSGIIPSAILFAEQTVPFPVDNQAPADVKRTLASARSSGSLTLGAILQIIPVKTTTNPVTNESETVALSFGEFLQSLGTRAPAELSRALADDFFFGIHTVDENAPLIIVPVISYERALAAMYAWEETMNADLEPLFTLLSPQTIGEDGLPKERVFEDTVMRNYDVRVIKDDQGVVQLYYSFPTRNVLIIAESPFSFTEILGRLRADRRL